MTEQNRTDAALRSLRARVGELSDERPRQDRYVAFAGLANALAVAVPVLSANTWFTWKVFAFTAWHQPAEINWFGYLAVSWVMAAVAVSILVTHRVTAGHRLHWLVAWITGVGGACLLVLGVQLDDNTDTAPAFWLTVVAMVGLTVLHGYRGDLLNRERRGV